MWRPGGSPDVQQCQQNKARLWYRPSRWSVPFQSSSPQLGGFSLCPGVHSPKPGKGPRIPKLLPLWFQVLSGAWKRVGQEQGQGGVFLWLPVPFLVSSTAKADGTWRREQKGFIPAGEEAESGVNLDDWGA